MIHEKSLVRTDVLASGLAKFLLRYRRLWNRSWHTLAKRSWAHFCLQCCSTPHSHGLPGEKHRSHLRTDTAEDPLLAGCSDTLEWHPYSVDIWHVSRDQYFSLGLSMCLCSQYAHLVSPSQCPLRKLTRLRLKLPSGARQTWQGPQDEFKVQSRHPHEMASRYLHVLGHNRIKNQRWEHTAIAGSGSRRAHACFILLKGV